MYEPDAFWLGKSQGDITEDHKQAFVQHGEVAEIPLVSDAFSDSNKQLIEVSLQIFGNTPWLVNLNLCIDWRKPSEN